MKFERLAKSGAYTIRYITILITFVKGKPIINAMAKTLPGIGDYTLFEIRKIINL